MIASSNVSRARQRITSACAQNSTARRPRERGRREQVWDLPALSSAWFQQFAGLGSQVVPEYQCPLGPPQRSGLALLPVSALPDVRDEAGGRRPASEFVQGLALGDQAAVPQGDGRPRDDECA